MSSIEKPNVLKLVHGDAVHRWRYDATTVTFQELLTHSRTFWNNMSGKCTFSYHDEEKELITVSNSAELAEAFHVVEHSGQTTTTLRLFVHLGGDVEIGTKPTKDQHSSDKQTAAALAFKNRHVKAKQPTPKPSTPSTSSAPSKPSKPVPLEVTSGGAKLFLDGTCEFGLGGDAFLQPDGTVRCIMNGSGFPSVKCQDLSVVSGKWYYELHLLTGGCMQVGWVTPKYTGDAQTGDGVGDDPESWAYDGHRQTRWNGKATPWGTKWKPGDTVCCVIDCDRGELRYALNGQWPSYSESLCFNGIPVKQLGGLTPAVSFSNGEKCRFNFGADGTPLAFDPPDPSFVPIWHAFGTVHNVASTPVGRRGGGHSMPSSHGESKQQHPPPPRNNTAVVAPTTVKTHTCNCFN